ncbi:MAG: UDP-glucose 4-epimerase family protein [Gammaproteobacteria bacterium]
MTNQKILITGANGFIGRSVRNSLLKNNYHPRCAYRFACNNEEQESYDDSVFVGDIDDVTDWSLALEGIDVVIHLAARVHVMKEHSKSPLEEFRKVNVLGTEKLGLDAAKYGVKRLIYISSIKVNGEVTTDTPYNERSMPHPVDPYGVSKYEAELALKKISNKEGLEIVIIRPPLVYGPGVKGNFLSLMKLINSGLPLPLGCINNSRSLVSINNLTDFIVRCIDHPNAANETFMVSDRNDLSTADLVKHISYALNRTPKLLSVQPWLLEILAGLFGKKDVVQRLVQTLKVDCGKANMLLEWYPPNSTDEEIFKTVSWYINRAR